MKLKHRMQAVLLCTIALCGAGVLHAQQSSARPWMNKSLSADERADLVLHAMTLDEKIQMVHGIGWGPLRAGAPVPPGNNGGAGEVVGVARLGIPDLNQADSAVGIRMAAPESRYATLLPSVLGAAATWDTDGARLYGDVIGRELRAQGYNESIGGGVNLARDPRNGRNFEYSGEDPVLAGTMVGNLIQGVQANDVMGDIKHFALNDQETGRTIVNVEISHKAARESDLLAFEIGIRIGHPASVMCSYNKVNGDWSCENDWLLNQTLKGDWHFPGFVLSDWEGTHSAAKAALAGLDMEQPGEVYFGAPLKEAVTAGKVPQARLDDMVHRILRSMFAAGVIDHPPLPRRVVDPFKGRDDAQHIAEESIVLLKNRDAVLPLDASRLRSVAVIGAHADVGLMSGGGSAQVDAPGGNAISPATPTQWGHAVYFPSAPLRYIKEHAPQAQVRFASGQDVNEAVSLARSADVAVVFADQYASEGADTLTLTLPNHQDELIAAVTAANPRTVVVLVTGNPVTMPWADQAAGILEAWYPGIGGGQAIADLLFGTSNPSGKLPITFVRSIEDLPHPRIFGIDASRGDAGLPEHWTAEEQKTSFPADLTEGVRFGYKWAQSEHKVPLYPFGFGLSYTSYRYSALQVAPDAGSVTFELTNTGQRAGTEIAQIYVQLPAAAGEQFRRLAGFTRVPLNPGEHKTVTVKLEPLALDSFDEGKHQWKRLAGEYAVSVGGSSRGPAADGKGERTLMPKETAMPRLFTLFLAALLLTVSGARLEAQTKAAGTLAAQPPMGWNSWDAYGLTITESEFRANVDVLARTLKPFGWNVAVIDEGWFLKNPQDRPTPDKLAYELDANGRYIPVPARFPSALVAGQNTGFKSVGEAVHAQGLKFGIHIVRGIPRESVSRNLPVAGSRFKASDVADTTDVCPWDPTNWGVRDNAAGQAWYDALLAQYAGWGVDYLKVDCISDHPFKLGEIQMIHRAILKTGRPIILSLSPGPTSPSVAAQVAANAQLWRISDDVWDYWKNPRPFPRSLYDQFELVAAWAPHAHADSWPDADMLPFGYLGPAPGFGTARQSSLTLEEERTMLTLWSVARSPLILGANLTKLSDDLKGLLINRDVLALNQNGHDPRQLAREGTTVTWATTGGDGKTYLALFNLGDEPAQVTHPFAFYALGSQPRTTEELWTHATTAASAQIDVSIPPHGVKLYRLN